MSLSCSRPLNAQATLQKLEKTCVRLEKMGHDISWLVSLSGGADGGGHGDEGREEEGEGERERGREAGSLPSSSLREPGSPSSPVAMQRLTSGMLRQFNAASRAEGSLPPIGLKNPRVSLLRS